ncbi:MAG: molybdenum ABC transporter ATP-binding protein [Gammaproteobacteria bacterium]|nr:molybdenum ABC transporter ATP-binding protein [Gammaproteobacteria bacterium]
MRLDLKLHIKKGSFCLKADTQIQWRSPCIHVIFGESGIGKTHLLRSICGLEKGEGKIHWHHKGKTITWLDSQQKKNIPSHARHVTMMFQDAQLFPHLNVEDNLKFAFKRANANADDWQHCIDSLRLEKLLPLNVDALSGGQAQRVALARAILSKPELLILDEPLASLDWHSKQEVMEYLKRLCDQWQLPVLYVTHDVNEVLALAEDVLLLHAMTNVTTVDSPKALIDVLQSVDHPFHRLGKSSILHIGTPQEAENMNGLIALPLKQQIIYVPKPKKQSKAYTRLCIAANDVSLSLSQPNDSSIVNILKGEVCRIDDLDGHYLIQLDIDGQKLLSEISAYSFERMNIKVGMEIFAQIKGVALSQ